MNIENEVENTEEIQQKEAKLYAGKYKTPEDLEKGYKELSTLVRVKNPEAPEEYDFSVVEGVDGENPLLGTMQEVMKNQNLTQDQATALTEAFVGFSTENTPDMEEEVKKLGGDASVMIQQVEGFMKRYLNEEETAILSQVGGSAEGIKLLHKLSQQMGEKAIPAGSSSNDVSGDLRKQAAEMLKDPAFRNNSEKQSDYDALWQKIAYLER
jgi:hypothetical protein